MAGEIIYDSYTPEFSLRRSYCPAIMISSDYTVEPVLTGQVIEWTSAAGYVFRLKISDRFFNWSSNSYTWDYIMDEAGSSIDCVLFPCFDIVLVEWTHNINDGQPCIKLQPLSSLTNERMIQLPPAPPDYWLRLPPG